MKIHPLHDWVVMKCDPHQPKSTIIEMPKNESSIRTGTVLEVGPGKYHTGNPEQRVPVGVVVGDRLAFLRWHQEHRPGQAVVKALADLSEQLGADVCMIRQADILFTFDGDVRVDVP